MKNRMNKSMRIWLILVILIVVAILAALWATSTFWFPRFPSSEFRPPPRPATSIPGDLEFFYTLQTVVSTINATLLIFLLLIYISIYMKTRSQFTIGLIIFSMILLLYALTSNPLVTRIFGFRAFGLGPFAMLPDLFTCAALVVLLYLTLKY
jgi:hypothetical protein